MRHEGAQEDGSPPCSQAAQEMKVGPCVQLRLVYSAGDRPAGVRVRIPVTWIAGWRETKILKPIDKVSEREIVSVQAVTKVNAQVATELQDLEG